jgi:hypothetical protein
LDQLWNLIPAKESEGARVIVDFGASAFQSFLMWGIQNRGLQELRTSGFAFIFFVPVQSADSEAAGFFNEFSKTLLKIGKLVLIKNFREGTDFSLLDKTSADQVPHLTVLHKGRPLTTELQQQGNRLTFRQLAELNTASRRARLDAAECAEHFSDQFQKLRGSLGI